MVLGYSVANITSVVESRDKDTPPASLNSKRVRLELKPPSRGGPSRRSTGSSQVLEADLALWTVGNKTSLPPAETQGGYVVPLIQCSIFEGIILGKQFLIANGFGSPSSLWRVSWQAQDVFWYKFVKLQVNAEIATPCLVCPILRWVPDLSCEWTWTS